MSKTTTRKIAVETAPSLRQRAARLRDAAGRFLKRATVPPGADQPQPTSLPEGSPADRTVGTFPAVAGRSHDADRGHPEDQDRDPAAGGRVPRGEHTMGRHESFDTATPIAAEMVESTLLGGRQSSDPIFAAIAESQRLYEVWTATNALPEMPGTLDRPPEAEAAQAAFHRHTEDVLLVTRPTTAEGCKALAGYAADFRQREGFSLDGRDGIENGRVLALIARSPAVERTIGHPTVSLDPIYATIAETRRLMQVEDIAKGKRKREAAMRARLDHCDGVLLQTVPTTAQGCVALARFAKEY